MKWTLPTDVPRVTRKYVGFAFNAVLRRGVITTLAEFIRTAWFDLRHGLRATIPVEVTSSGAAGQGSVLDAVQYQGVLPHLALEMLHRLPPRALRAHFVDYGCGKGRGMAVGMIAGFRRVLGVEMMPELATMAEGNLLRMRRRFPETVVHVCVMDAAMFVPREGPLVAFLYNPFHGETLRTVVRRIREHARMFPVWVVYVNPRQINVFHEAGFKTESEKWTGDELEAVILLPPPIDADSESVRAQTSR
jgi:protein-L-isoaspartate O-methyltransferase